MSDRVIKNRTKPFVTVGFSDADYICDGTADDVQIQAAIDAVAALGGGKVLLKAGQYNIAAGINITHSSINLEGVGNATIIYVSNGANVQGAINVTGSGVVEVKLKNFKIDGNKSNQSNGDGIYIKTPWATTDCQHVVEDVYVYNCKNNGIEVGVSGDTRVLEFNRVHVKACDGNGWYLPVPSCTDSTFYDCIADTIGLNGFYIGCLNSHFTDCKTFYCGSTVGSNHGFYITGYNNYFTQCEAQDNYQSGFYLDATGDATYGAYGNTFVNCLADSNGQSANASYCKGFQIVNTNQIQITSGITMNRPYGSYWQNYGISFEGTSNDNSVNGMLFFGNNTSPIRDVSSGTNYTSFNNYNGTTSPSSYPGLIKVTRANGTDSGFEVWRTGNSYPRTILDGFGSLTFGGLGSAAPPLTFRKDPFNQQFGNFTNTAGPATILIADSDVANTGGPNAESTFTGRVITGSGGSEFIDWFHNHYSTNGDIEYGILAQRISPGSYRDFIMGFTDNASSDPSGQIKNRQAFYTITPTIAVGTSGGTTLTGTASTTATSVNMVGVGTLFTTQLKVGDSFAIGSEYRTVDTITDNTHLAVTAAFANTVSGLTINKFNRFLGRMGIRVRNPLAFMHIAGGVGGSTVGSASLKIDPATALLTTPEDGAIEYDGTHLYTTISSTRYQLDQQAGTGVSSVSGTTNRVTSSGGTTPSIDISASYVGQSSITTLGTIATGVWNGTAVSGVYLDTSVGISGGRTLTGGTAASNSLTLSSTSNGTKGNVLLGTSAYDEVNNRLGILTTTPTHSLTIASTGTGEAIYNTSDQTTNYERLAIKYATNVIQIYSENGGTGVQRNIRFGDSANYLEDAPAASGGSPKFTLTRTASSTASLLQLNHAGMSASSGGQSMLNITPTVAQSGTAGYTSILTNVTESSTGSGSKLLMDLQVGGVSQFNIGNTGNVTLVDGANIAVATTTGTKIGTATSQKLGFWNATPVVQPSAYTQTYSTASKTHPNATAATLTDNSAGTADTTLEALANGTVYATDVAAIRNNFADLAAMVNKDTADILDLKKVVNQILDDLQSIGILS